MTEDEALAAIEERCRSGDLEGNGSQLDKIIGEFLRAHGYDRLADAADNVECWRAWTRLADRAAQAPGPKRTDHE